MEETMINVAHIEPCLSQGVNGPGRRMVLWVQGCPLRCKGCFNQDFLEFGVKDHSSLRRVSELIELYRTARDQYELDGITFSGGEPMSHAVGLAPLSEEVRKLEANVVMFTGTTPEMIRSIRKSGKRYTPAVQLIDNCDLIVAGPYEEEDKIEQPSDLRGSSNQENFFFGGKLQVEDIKMNGLSELFIDEKGNLGLSGFPGDDRKEQMQALLKGAGLG